MSERAYLTPNEMAKLIGIKAEKILVWIHSGELRAANMAENADGQRPRWRIAKEEIERFFAARSNKPLAPITPAPRRRKAKPSRQWV